MWTTFPLFGSALLLAIMIAATYTLVVALQAGSTGSLRSLQAARLGAYGTVAVIGVAVLCLAYAFVSHDFRLRYVSHYSDRSMPLHYLLTALWGGQDGSLLWWLFLLSVYIGACVKWLGNKYIVLQPYVIATLMAVVVFFAVLMTFAANPFSTSIAGARPDGEGLNPLLQNFYMIIHPPSLYVGFVGCSIPFAFAVAALVTGRLDHEWIVASRKWTLFAWLFLAIGNTLGMLWAYEELGWGGYWAWDPVENAAFMPLITASAYVHSVMIQERRGLLKVWNVALICVTFFLTIFGTFLTRSGAIASVHSFAQSSIGTYFVWFLALLAIFSFTLVLYRWPELRDLPPSPKLRTAAVSAGWLILLVVGPGIAAVGKLPMPPSAQVLVSVALAGAAVYAGVELVFRRAAAQLGAHSKRPEIESIWSREFTFLLNNWGLLGLVTFVLVATTFPMISEALGGEKVTVGPPYYNAWVQPIGLTIFVLMGVGTLFGWKKTSPRALRRAFIAPLAVTAVAMVLHVLVGKAVGFPAVVWSEAIYGGALGDALRAFNAVTPLLGFGSVVFNAVVIVQEFVMLYRARARTGAGKTPAILYWLGLVPGFFVTMVTLPPPSRRRYGGYIVHMGIVLMFLGFTGKSWTIDKETSMSPGQTYQVEGYTVEYVGPRMEVDNTKRMIFADLRVSKHGRPMGDLGPAKFIYKKMPESPTTEVAMMHTLRDDLYVVVGSINPQTKVAALQIHVNPLVSWIWFGALLMIVGSIVCMWPELQEEESRVWAFSRSAAAAATSVILGILLASLPAPAFAQQTSSSLHSGTVRIETEEERHVFSQLRCMCGDCARDLLSTCACSTAEEAREDIRRKLAAGQKRDEIILAYAAEHGTDALAVPPNSGGLRAIYAVPIFAIGAGGLGLVLMIRKWSRAGERATAEAQAKKRSGKKGLDGPGRDEYDDRLDEELRDLDD
jgi:cytochrome c-type biogenesis protein CcmF